MSEGVVLCSSMNSEPSALNSLMMMRPSWLAGVTGPQLPAPHVSYAWQAVVAGVSWHTPTPLSTTQAEV